MSVGELREGTQARDLGDDQLDPRLLAEHCFDGSFGGAYKVEACYNPSPLSVTIRLYIIGIKIAEGVINAAKPCINLGGSVTFGSAYSVTFKLTAKVCVDVQAKKITIDAEGCRRSSCKKYHHEWNLPLVEAEQEEQTSLWVGNPE
jgi:hypothetical protein